MGMDRKPDVGPSKREIFLPSSVRDVQSSRRVPFRNMVLTPASVPEFTIPSLCPGRQQIRARRHTMPRSTHPSLLVRTLTHCCPLSDVDDLENHALSDPTTRAAMSLPHLSKITTPYGFVTLGESPCVRRRESLFFEEKEHATCLTTHRPLDSLNKSFADVEKVIKTASGEDSVARLQDSCNYSESEKSTCFPKRSERKRWLKCLLKNPSHR
ncbi:C2 calcium-dependent domain-containing protein 4A [Triplophysa tibetana]|uniref:C2 calcium-dependent domain-containing protein 4A n=1 Tax=Triplophysa tibetana TaxID=1572043 RepID=A0A5A9N2V2_9TELE|nr:C2 calcium-dependent domain-containing protein 4A [Triplophysa tibetana]